MPPSSPPLSRNRPSRDKALALRWEGQVSARDPDASFIKKHGKTCFGDKAHLSVDEGSGIIRQAEMSSADSAQALACRWHDSQMEEDLIQGDEKAFTPTRPMTAPPCARP